MITLKDIRLSYGERVIFDGLNATIGPKDRIALVGANGSGKTTLVKAMIGDRKSVV